MEFNFNKEFELIDKELTFSDWDKIIRRGKLMLKVKDHIINQLGYKSFKSYFKDGNTVGKIKYIQASKLVKIAENEIEMKKIYDEGYININKLTSEFGKRFHTKNLGGLNPKTTKTILAIPELGDLNKIEVSKKANENNIRQTKIARIKIIIDKCNEVIKVLEEE